METLKKHKWKFLILALVLGAAVGGAVWYFKFRDKEEEEPILDSAPVQQKPIVPITQTIVKPAKSMDDGKEMAFVESSVSNQAPTPTNPTTVDNMKMR